MAVSDQYLRTMFEVAVLMSASNGRAERIIANWQMDWLTYVVKSRVV